MKKDEFHVPFIQSLIIVAIVTVFSMRIAHHFINYSLSSTQNTPVFTSSQSQYSSDTEE